MAWRQSEAEALLRLPGAPAAELAAALVRRGAAAAGVTCARAVGGPIPSKCLLVLPL